MKPLICVRHQTSAPLGIIEDVLARQEIPWTYLDTWIDSPLPDPSDIGGLVILGGEMNVDLIDVHPYLGDLRDLTRAMVDRGQPVLGVCLGAQVLARALGAPVRRMPVREIGFHEVEATEAGRSDPVLVPFSPSARVFQFHEDTCDLPQGAELLFRGRTSEVQAFRIGERAYGVQFHFEVTIREIAAWCDETPDLEDAWGVTKEELLAQADEYLEAQGAAGREAVRRFLSLTG